MIQDPPEENADNDPATGEAGPSEDSVSTIWPAWAAKWKPRDSALKKNVMNRFVRHVERVFPQLLEGKPGLVLSPEEHQSCLEEVLAAARDAEDSRRFERWWDLLIDAGNAEGRWSISFQAARIVLPPTRTVFVRRDFQLLERYRDIAGPLHSNIIETECPTCSS